MFFVFVLFLFFFFFFLVSFVCFVNWKKQNVFCAHEFSFLLRKLYVPHRTFLEIWLLFQAPFLVKNKFLSNLKRQNFLHFFIKKVHKKNEYLKKKTMSYVHMYFPGSQRKSYVLHTSFLGFSAIMQNDITPLHYASWRNLEVSLIVFPKACWLFRIRTTQW